MKHYGDAKNRFSKGVSINFFQTFKKFLVCLMVACFAITGCTKDFSPPKIEGAFIAINNDVRKPGLAETDYYKYDVSMNDINESSNEPGGMQFVMDISDVNKQYIGDIGGVFNTTKIVISIDAYEKNFDSKTTLKTLGRNGRYSAVKEIMQDRCAVFIQLKNEDDRIIKAGHALPNQDVTIEKINNKYYVTFNNLNFGDGPAFTGSARLVTD